MLSNLIFSLNATVPILLMMVIGYILKRIKFIDTHTCAALNKLVFRVFLPALLFLDLANQDFAGIWDSSFVLFCAVTTILSILIALGCSVIMCRDMDDRGEFIQASFRSAAATLGIAFMTNIYDNVAMVALMIIGSVPIYNIVSVIVLSLTSPDNNTSNQPILGRTLKNVITNPIILSIFAGLIWSLLPLKMPFIMEKSITYLGNVASPLALIALGAAFEFKNLKEKCLPIIAVVFNKLVLFTALFLPLAIYMGFRDEKLVAALIMLGSGTTSSSFIMAKNMGHNGTISSSAVMTTTFLSSFTMTIWLFIIRSLGYI